MDNIFNEEFKNEDLLRYGKILTNDDFEDCTASEEGCCTYDCTRIRTIKYDNHIYYHKMVNGEAIEAKELM